MSEKVKELTGRFNNYFVKPCSPGINFVKVSLDKPLQMGDIHFLSELGSTTQAEVFVKRSGKGLTVIATI